MAAKAGQQARAAQQARPTLVSFLSVYRPLTPAMTKRILVLFDVDGTLTPPRKVGIVTH